MSFNASLTNSLSPCGGIKDSGYWLNVFMSLINWCTSKSGMANDAVFRSSLICLAVVIVGVGIYTQWSVKKMMGTYVLGMLGVCGILLPDWDYFGRPISQWCSPITLNKTHAAAAAATPPSTTRFKVYPVRLMIYALIYSYGFYKWWMFISN